MQYLGGHGQHFPVLNDSVVGGKDASFGALARLLPTVDVHTFWRSSVKDLHFD